VSCRVPFLSKVGFTTSVLPKLRVSSPPKTSMSLFPEGSGVTGAVSREDGRISVELPFELDNADEFVYDTMTSRVPTKIIGRTVEYNQGKLDQARLDAMAAIGEEMRSNGNIVALSLGPNVAMWNDCLKPYLDKSATWNQLPWYVAETYVYHRLLEASGYWEEGGGKQVDIFAAEKEEALGSALPLVAGRMDACVKARGVWSEDNFRRMLQMALWGNQGDSSLFTVADLKGKGEQKLEGMLIDDGDDVFGWLDTMGSASAEVHMLNDNSGMELVSDLALAHYLLTTDKVGTVVLHLKPYPFFVSDATETDLRYTIGVLAKSDDANQKTVGSELQGWLDSGKLQFSTDTQLNMDLASPQPMWCLHADARKTLSKATIAIAKGDLMYRKLLGDRKWEVSEPFDALCSYFPCPLVALRTCKSPLAVGMNRRDADKLDADKPTWKVDGDCGMIQACFPPPGNKVTWTASTMEVQYDAAKVEEDWKKLAELDED